MQSDELNRMSQTIINDIKREFTRFLQEFGDRKYITMGESILDSGKHLIVISYQDFITHNSDLASTIFQEYYRYEPHLNDAFTHFMRELERNYFIGQQPRTTEDNQQKYFITFDTEQHPESLRDLKCNRLGRLTVLQGTITRTTEVKPELSVGVFRCLSCGLISRPIPQQFKYTEPKKCSGMNCDKVQWELEHGRSQFSDFQKLRIQEDPTKIPPGAMPRSLDVIIRDDNVQKGQPGDVCRFVGYLCVLPELSSMMKPGEKTIVSTRSIQNRGNMMEMEGITGLKGIRQLNYKLIFMATNIIVENNSFNEEMDEPEQEERYDEERPKKPYEEQKIFEKAFEKLSEQEIMTIKQLKGDNNLYEQMANSLFPSIFGQPEIKKALLLQLFGGIHKVTSSSRMNIRGDINILIVGDPSTAKSQFLKCVNKFVPRSVYTNGKTTSAAGLTASVSRDENGQVGIEAGALMLADNGICCIDEFDKMEIHDQVAIHEAMQQQTISIAKAGVHATLNARTSILAAANPLFGRYDKSKALKQNINISAPIMSRFDLFFVICDETSEASDAHLSEFLLNMHRNKELALTSKYDTKTLKLYISTARKLKPRLTIPAGELLKKYYHNLRVNDKTQHNTSYRVTVRQLQSMIRLSEAFARLHFELQITEEYVQEAHRLISTSIMKLEKSPIELLTDEIDQMGLQSKAFKAIDKKIEQIGEQKKSKSISISHELYQEIVKNTLNFFKEQKLLSRTQEQPQIHQVKLTDYLLAINFENDMLNTEAETIQWRKIIGAVIKKMIREERILMTISEDNENGKILGVHPNYME